MLKCEYVYCEIIGYPIVIIEIMYVIPRMNAKTMSFCVTVFSLSKKNGITSTKMETAPTVSCVCIETFGK